MNRIEKMIKEMCPEGVRWVRLSEVITHLRTGLNPRVHFILNTDDAKGYYITVRELMGKSIVPDEKTDRINESACMRINERSKLQLNDILFSGTGTIGRTAIVTAPPTNWNIKEGVYALTPNSDIILPLYLLYLLHSENIIEQISNKAGGSTVKSIPMAEMRNLQIPLPPLPIQQEIVNILDSFTALQQNLEDELKLRQKQYEHYREKLLTFEDGECEWKKLGEVCTKTFNINWNKENNGSYCYIDLSCVEPKQPNIGETTQINKDNAPSRAKQIVKTGDILLGTTRPTQQRLCKVTDLYDNQICSTGFCVIRSNSAMVSTNWLYYVINSNRFWEYAETYQKGAGYPAISNSDVFDFEIPLVQFEKQSQITQTLDHFESLISNLKTEIEFRKKQYEYYREKLLTFE